MEINSILKRMSKQFGYEPLFLQNGKELQESLSIHADDQSDVACQVQGLLSDTAIRSRAEELKKLDVDSYIEAVMAPSENKSRRDARAVVRLAKRIVNEVADGPLFAAELELDFGDAVRRVGFLCQNRKYSGGVWQPKHHRLAAKIAKEFASYNIPIVTFIDTPGADAREASNVDNQAHSISQLIAEMAALPIPTVGIVMGSGYSGGAIPLATCNLLLSVRDGIFNTIQPQGLASIVHKYNLTWQECAKYVGTSAYELYSANVLDGIIDYAPGERGEKLDNLHNAIVSGIQFVEVRAKAMVREEPRLVVDYFNSLQRILTPVEKLKKLQSSSECGVIDSLTNFPTVIGVSCRQLRYLKLRNRLTYTTVDNFKVERQSDIPTGNLSERQRQEKRQKFLAWIDDEDRIVLDEDLKSSWMDSKQISLQRYEPRGTLGQLLHGDPEKKYAESKQSFCFNAGLYLYKRWKEDAASNFTELLNWLGDDIDSDIPQVIVDIRNRQKNVAPDLKDITVIYAITAEEMRKDFIHTCNNMLLFDALYNSVVHGLVSVAKEAQVNHSLSKSAVASLLGNALEKMVTNPKERPQRLKEFFNWISQLTEHHQKANFLQTVEEWKKLVFPRVSDSLFVIITFFLEKLVPAYFVSEDHDAEYDGRINPVRIGRRKDFWNRLSVAYRDLLIREELDIVKGSRAATVVTIIERYFTKFNESDSQLVTSDPLCFPGFKRTIEREIKKGGKPCGVVTGIGVLKGDAGGKKVGVMISNLEFQAGAFDMASAEKFCRLMRNCAKQKLPIVCFISSGGMQTKEGAAALFSMAILNERLSRFIIDNELPVIAFGFGDCTGGAQASFMTHPLVESYYFSGTNMPFAGQIVVPSFLPATATLSNYLSSNPASMKGLVKHPFASSLDNNLMDIDPSIPVPRQTVEEVLKLELELMGRISPKLELVQSERSMNDKKPKCFRKINKLLIYARGCTAMKLIRKAQENGYEVTLVASDPDMNAAPSHQLTERDNLVCIGGNTPEESYLNGESILQVANRYDIDTLHPGIGFLSESPDFVSLCEQNEINFIGPSVSAMDAMGNKSNAINLAIKCGVPVVPGSHGPLGSVSEAAEIAKSIGFPVLLKAVHGGGGKGINLVTSADQIESIYPQGVREAEAAFGNGELYLEKYIESFRHVEVQVLRDKHGNTVVLGIRDCTVQRQNQKLVEESGSTLLPEWLEADIRCHARNLCNEVEYVGAATVEFIFDLEAQAAYFMEANSRLQVEHPVTEMAAGVDIVSHQFSIAEGESIEGLKGQSEGYAIEVRINAEKLERQGDNIQLLPSPGVITECKIPADVGVEVISIVETGREISPYYDSMIMQVIAKANTRAEAIDKLNDFLGRVRISGISTNIPLIRKILDDEIFQQGDYDQQIYSTLLERIDVDALIREIDEAAGLSQSDMDQTDLTIEGTDEVKVLSPLTGVFYGSASPSDPPYIQEGGVVDTDSTLCLLEAMKVFTTLSLKMLVGSSGGVFKEGHSYTITRINAREGHQVARGDILFLVKPADTDDT